MKLDWPKVAAGLIVAAVIGAVSSYLSQSRTVAKLEERVAVLQEQVGAQGAEPQGQVISPKGTAADGRLLNPRELVEIVREQQRAYVPESSAEYAHQSFGEDDLERFVEEGVASTVASNLRDDKAFLEVVLALSGTAPAKRQQILEEAEKPLRPTWEELGRIDPAGQTEAGQEAEILIASAIVDLVGDLLALSPEELVRIYEK